MAQMLDRYRKPGGFVQLLTVLETCGPTKREQFLKIIGDESRKWAEALRSKILELPRIYGWNDNTLLEILGTLQDLTIAVTMIGAEPTFRTRVLNLLPLGRRRRIDELMEMHKPTPGEIASMQMKIVETTRKLATEGSIRFEKFDPAMVIDDDIERELERAGAYAVAAVATSEFKIDFGGDAPMPEPEIVSSSNTDDGRVQEIAVLRKKLSDSAKENAILRHELNVAKSKLDQIKKIA